MRTSWGCCPRRSRAHRTRTTTPPTALRSVVPGRRRERAPRADPDRRRALTQAETQAERPGHPPGQVVLGHRGVDVDDGQAETCGLLAEPVGKHPVTFEQVG